MTQTLPITSSIATTVHCCRDSRATSVCSGWRSLRVGRSYCAMPDGIRNGSNHYPAFSGGFSNEANRCSGQKSTIPPSKSSSPTFGPTKRVEDTRAQNSATKSMDFQAALSASTNSSGSTCFSSGRNYQSASPFNFKMSNKGVISILMGPSTLLTA